MGLFRRLTRLGTGVAKKKLSQRGAVDDELAEFELDDSPPTPQATEVEPQAEPEPKKPPPCGKRTL